MNIVGKIRPFLRSIKKTDVVWRFGSNLKPTVTYRARRDREVSNLQKTVIEGLNKDGIFVTTIDALFGNEGSDLEIAVTQLLESKKADIDELKANVDNDGTIGDKTFNLECLGSEVTFDADSIFARLALDDKLLSIANAYLGMHAKLRYYNVWYTAASQTKPRESQLWHFDREDNYILKVFIYLKDVDEGTGPFTYATKTHRKGKFRSAKPEYALEGVVRRTNDEQMAAIIPTTEWIRGTGKKGTVIFADTRGYHKGGEARTHDRVMYTCMYTSPASESKDLLHFTSDMDGSALSHEQWRALRYP